jgi:hypothetical protein
MISKKVLSAASLWFITGAGAGCGMDSTSSLALHREVGGSYPPCTQSFIPQGRSMQGRSMQGRSMQGRSMQGSNTEGWRVEAVRLGCTYVEDLQLQGTQITGSVDGQPLPQSAFLGATVIEEDREGNYSASTISAIENDPKDSSGATKLYTLTYVDDNGATQNVCMADGEGVAKAIPVGGSWDDTGAHTPSTTTFTFGCTKGVIAKCVRWGYRPWQTKNGKSLAEYHQICTRMARADYCGDGVTHTQDGTLVDVYDDLGIQVKSGLLQLPLLVFDAAWTTRGAYCMTKDRWLVLSQLLSVTTECKTKFLDLFPLVETSPVDVLDICAIKRSDVPRSDVHIDNKSGLNIQLF